SSLQESAATLVIRGPVILGDFALLARTALDLNRGLRVCGRILGRNDLGDNAAVGLVVAHPDAADRHGRNRNLTARLVDDVFARDEIILLAAVAALLAAVPALFMGDPMGAAGARNRLVATLIVHVPDETFLRRDVLVHFLDGIFFRLSGHGFLRQWD